MFRALYLDKWGEYRIAYDMETALDVIFSSTPIVYEEFNSSFTNPRGEETPLQITFLI